MDTVGHGHCGYVTKSSSNDKFSIRFGRARQIPWSPTGTATVAERSEAAVVD